MITYHKELFTDFFDEASEYFVDHYKEVEYFTDSSDLNIDTDAYKSLEDTGNLFCYTVRDEGKLVGYLYFIVSPLIHRKDKLSADCSAVYLDPSYRGGTIAYDLFCYAEDDLCGKGIFTIKVSMKNKARFENLMKVMNYNMTEIVYSKCIGEDNV